MFVDEIMELVELTPSREALVGLPVVNGLWTEQRKRLTIAMNNKLFFFSFFLGLTLTND